MTGILVPTDPRAARAWWEYRESLRGLEGREYEQAEARAWERLQGALEDPGPERASPPSLG